MTSTLHRIKAVACGLITAFFLFLSPHTSAYNGEMPVFKAGHESLQAWLLPDTPPSPADNRLTTERIELGKQLFADPRLSGTGQSTCLWCHSPERGWSDGLPTSAKLGGARTPLSSPTIVNLGYNKIFMWDGRKATLEDQGFGGQGKKADINALSNVEPEAVIKRLNNIKGYVRAFNKAYPGEGLTRQTVAKALSSFERSVISNNSPFDQWVRGKKSALTTREINGFKVFVNPEKGNCATCHNPPNFSDNGFHNTGLAAYGRPDHHPGRYKHVKLKLLDGAFKTPTLRDVSLTAPYMHDGSYTTLEEVVEHYVKGGEVKTNLSPSMSGKLNLNNNETQDLVMFLKALTSDHKPFIYPLLPQD